MKVGAAVLRPLIVGLVIAVALACTPIIAAYSDSSLSSPAQRAIAVISSLVAGMAAAFGLRRSLQVTFRAP